VNRREEARVHLDSVREVQLMLREVKDFIEAPSDSPIEDQRQAAVAERMTRLASGGISGLTQVLLTLVTLVNDCADPAKVRAWCHLQQQNAEKRLEGDA
jgi:hypothetical protein